MVMDPHLIGDSWPFPTGMPVRAGVNRKRAFIVMVGEGEDRRYWYLACRCDQGHLHPDQGLVGPMLARHGLIATVPMQGYVVRDPEYAELPNY